MKINKISPEFNLLEKNIIFLPTPPNLNYIWTFGSLLGVILILQIITGLIVSIHYAAELSISFDRVIHIIKDLNLGWSFRNLHINGASFFFFIVFIHIYRGLIYGSFKNKKTWISGILILFVLIGTAFLGYVLPWGQISFWGATVITNLVSAIPYLGVRIVQWLWGGFSVGNATLNRFYTLHFLLPFILSALILIHLISLHEKGSRNPTNSNRRIDKILFHPFFSFKDLMGFLMLFLAAIFLINLYPNILGDPENWNPSNPLRTPVHIQPEWYFLFAYAILRAIPNKLGGVVALVLRILILIPLMVKQKLVFSNKFLPFNKAAKVLLISVFVLLTWCGAQVVEPPFEQIRIFIGLIYFILFFLI